jgi:hypothetical protein
MDITARRRRRRALQWLVAASCAVLAVSAIGAAGAGAKGKSKSKFEIKHVFVVVLENENFDSSFGPSSAAPYLSQTLRSRGAFLPNYYGIGHASLDNYIAMISGQAPNPTTQSDCPTFSDFTPGTPAPGGQFTGTGCVYPASTLTLPNLLEKRHLTWKGYMEDMANGPGQPTTCRHPAIGTPDTTEAARVGDQYATRHDPFVYFHSIIDKPTCARNVVDLTKLSGDLASKKRAPNFAFITPNLCHDGHDAPCVNGEPGGLASANQWLATNVPAILASKAYRDHGVLIVTFDEAKSGPSGDSSACCGELPGPNVTLPGGVGPGGGRVGAVAISKCIRPGTTDLTPYNHYSLLRSLEGFFGVRKLGFSAQAGLVPIGKKTFTKRSACTSKK